MHKGEKWDQNNFDVNNIFAFQMALDIIQNDDDPEPQNTNECRQRNDWPKWRETMQEELHSLIKRDVFGLVVQTPASRGGKIGPAGWASPVRPKLGPGWAIKFLARNKPGQIWPGPVWPGSARPSRFFFCLEMTIWPDRPGF